MDEPQIEAVEVREPKPQNQFSRWSGIIFMVAILTVAGLVSALTAMRFAIRGKEVEVPKLVGKTKEEAELILRNGGLKLKVTSSRFSSSVCRRQSVEQIPSSGTRLKAERTVKVLVSLGEQRFAVPNLVGTSLRAAQLTLAQRRFTAGKHALHAHPRWRSINSRLSIAQARDAGGSRSFGQHPDLARPTGPVFHHAGLDRKAGRAGLCPRPNGRFPSRQGQLSQVSRRRTRCRDPSEASGRLPPDEV